MERRDARNVGSRRAGGCRARIAPFVTRLRRDYKRVDDGSRCRLGSERGRRADRRKNDESQTGNKEACNFDTIVTDSRLRARLSFCILPVRRPLFDV